MDLIIQLKPTLFINVRDVQCYYMGGCMGPKWVKTAVRATQKNEIYMNKLRRNAVVFERYEPSRSYSIAWTGMMRLSSYTIVAKSLKIDENSMNIAHLTGRVTYSSWQTTWSHITAWPSHLLGRVKYSSHLVTWSYSTKCFVLAADKFIHLAEFTWPIARFHSNHSSSHLAVSRACKGLRWRPKLAQWHVH